MLNKLIEILSYICIIAIMVFAMSGIYNLLMWHFASYTLAFAVAVVSGCLYGILKIIKEAKQ